MSSNVRYPSYDVLGSVLVPGGVRSESSAMGAALKAIRQERGLQLWQVASDLEMSTENLRHYESGRNRLVAADIPRFADAYRVSRSYLVRRLGLLDEDELEQRDLTEDEQAELEELRRHPELRVEFLSLARTFEELSDQDKRGLLEALRWMARSRGIPTAE